MHDVGNLRSLSELSEGPSKSLRVGIPRKVAQPRFPRERVPLNPWGSTGPRSFSRKRRHGGTSAIMSRPTPTALPSSASCRPQRNRHRVPVDWVPPHCTPRRPGSVSIDAVSLLERPTPRTGKVPRVKQKAFFASLDRIDGVVSRTSPPGRKGGGNAHAGTRLQNRTQPTQNARKLLSEASRPLRENASSPSSSAAENLSKTERNKRRAADGSLRVVVYNDRKAYRRT